MCTILSPSRCELGRPHATGFPCRASLGVALRSSEHASCACLASPDVAPPPAWQVTLVGRSSQVLPQHASGVRAVFEGLLAERGIQVALNRKIAYATPQALHCEDGEAIPYDEAIWCTQGGAQDWLTATSLALDEGGFIAVHPTLASTNTPDVFAAGDVAAVLEYPRPKAGVFAVRQGMPLANNLRRALRGETLVPFIPQSTFLGLISDGGGACVASRGRMAYRAEWLWTLKDWIDRTWMHSYTDGLPPPMMMGGAPMGGAPSAVALASGEEALDALAHQSMRCGGCGAKVGVSVLNRVMQRLREGGHLPPDPPEVTCPACPHRISPDLTGSPSSRVTSPAPRNSSRPHPTSPHLTRPLLISPVPIWLRRYSSGSTRRTTAPCSPPLRSPRCTRSTSSVRSSTTPTSLAGSPPTMPSRTATQ